MSQPSSQIDLHAHPPRESHPSRRTALVVRIVTAGIALGLVLLAVIDTPILQGGVVVGWFKGMLFAAGICLGALCFAPLSWNQNALIVLISVAISLVIAEFVLRGLFGPRFLPLFQRDDRVLYRLVPGAERIIVSPPIYGSAVVRYQINSQGFRGPELARPGASTRVVVYGDSFIQGSYVRTEDTFTEQLKTRLAGKTGKSVEVVNA